jgi:hypothetical protein
MNRGHDSFRIERHQRLCFANDTLVFFGLSLSPFERCARFVAHFTEKDELPLLLLASSNDIAQWAGTRSAEERLPEFLRRLVLATTETATYVDFPSGDAVQLGGYDGIIEQDDDHAFIPKGLSVLELSTNANPKGKADSDYAKRTESPSSTGRGDVIPAETTFVFVTARRWAGKDKWAKARRGEKTWKDVRVLDAVDLEGWAEQAQATHIWLSRLMGLVPDGTDDIEIVWADWSEAITPTATPELVLAGRAKEAAVIVDWLTKSGRGSHTVFAESAEDALGIVGATIMSLPLDRRVPILARTVVVSTLDAFVQLSACSEPLILVPTYPAGTEIQRATRNGHRVVCPAGPAPVGVAPSGHMTIPRVDRREAESALIAIGLPEDRARELARVARRSMLTLRRRLATNPSLRLPDWATPEFGPSLLPMLLLGQFDESRNADRQALSSLAATDFNMIRDTLTRWSQEIDPPVRHVGTIWYLVSKEDAWSLLSRNLTKEWLLQFAAVAKNVLSEVHPKFELPPADRWAASIHGKEREYSAAIVAGVADTVALMGALSNDMTLQSGVAPALAAERIVHDLFDAVAGDWRGWASLSGVLPLLAEGAPDEFLRAVETQVASDEEAVSLLFQDDDNLMFSASSHTGLLWSLEVLAWSPEHLPMVARILATLDRLDPGGRIVNRPGNSLRSIFLPWLPQTSAVLETRLSVLNELRRHEPDASWRLLSALLPRDHDHSVYNPRPKWRDWVAEGAGTATTYGEIFQQTARVVEWMVSDADANSERWTALVDALANVGPDEFSAITSALEHFLGKTSEDKTREPIFDALRKLLSQHRSFPKATWALPNDRLNDIEMLLESATPYGTVSRLRWLFSNNPQLPEGEQSDWDKYQLALLNRQQAAMRELYAELKTSGMEDLAARVERPDELGRIFASSNLLPDEEEDGLLVSLLATASPPHLAFGRGYAGGWTSRLGETVAFDRILGNQPEWSDETRGRLLLAQMPNARTLDLIDSLGEGGKAAFWSAMHPYWIDASVVERCLRGLLEHGRAHAVVHAAAVHLRKHPNLSPELLATSLEAAPQQATDPNGTQMSSYDIGVVLDALERAVRAGELDPTRAAQLEFLYLPILGHFSRPPRMLHEAMGREPSLFVDAVRMAYRGNGENGKELDGANKRQAEHAYRLLDSWRIPPGKSDTGIDRTAMNAWVDAARETLAQLGRAEIGDHLIGQTMSGPAKDSDDIWPVIPIRELIERLGSDEFETGLVIGRYNGRGVTSRDPRAGGSIERSEAEAYERMAKKAAVLWPRTSAMLRRMSRDSRAEASREDIDSELRDDLDD